MHPVRLLLVDDSAEFLDAAQDFLAGRAGIEVAGRALSARAALEIVPVLQPDAVVMDLNMFDMNGLVATRRLKALPTAPRVVILTLYDNPFYREAATAVGVDGFIPKTELPKLLVPMIEQMFGGA